MSQELHYITVKLYFKHLKIKWFDYCIEKQDKNLQEYFLFNIFWNKFNEFKELLIFTFNDMKSNTSAWNQQCNKKSNIKQKFWNW